VFLCDRPSFVFFGGRVDPLGGVLCDTKTWCVWCGMRYLCSMRCAMRYQDLVYLLDETSSHPRVLAAHERPLS